MNKYIVIIDLNNREYVVSTENTEDLSQEEIVKVSLMTEDVVAEYRPILSMTFLKTKESAICFVGLKANSKKEVEDFCERHNDNPAEWLLDFLYAGIETEFRLKLSKEAKSERNVNDLPEVLDLLIKASEKATRSGRTVDAGLVRNAKVFLN